MLSIANKVFRDFKEFYNEINAATLTGAIDVIVVEQPDGSYLCSPFHVRFGKLGVLRSREKIVDIEINGEPIDIHMKLGESGEAFFVEECTEVDLNEVPDLATSPIPTSDISNYTPTTPDIKIPVPRRNSIDLTNNIAQVEPHGKFENQISDFSHRRHTTSENDARHDFSATKLEYTTQKLRQELGDKETEEFYDEMKEKFNLRLMDESQQFCPIDEDKAEKKAVDVEYDKTMQSDLNNGGEKKDDSNLVSKDDAKGLQAKRKRRKKSMIKKKNSQRKGSNSSSASFSSELEATDVISTNSNDISPTSENEIPNDATTLLTLNKDEQEEVFETTPPKENERSPARHEHLSDIHFFSDGECTSNTQQPRSMSPVQSDTEFEISQRDKIDNTSNQVEWKWGEPVVKTDDIDDMKEVNNKRNSMLSGMLSFMKQKRKSQTDGLYLADLDLEDPEIAAVYFPSPNKFDDTKQTREEDRESGNGTSSPQSPSNSMEMIKANFEYENNKAAAAADCSLNFVSLSMCGGLEKEGGPTEEEFNANIVQYCDICQNPALFTSPNLVVRINNKFYSWIAACPYIITLIAYQKELPHDVFEKIVKESKMKPLVDTKNVEIVDDHNVQHSVQNGESSRRSWFLWRRSGGGAQMDKKVSTPQEDNLLNDLSKSSMDEEFLKGNSNISGSTTTEMYRKTLRLNSNQIQSLNLKNGMNEVEFSVTTAYQGTSRCNCFLFKWKHNDKVVISDIDGTITRSDVLGHILPMVGKDWAQIGVAELFSKIEENGYKMLYLSARAIGQSRATRDYLKSIRQGDVKLPDGPLLLNPTSLISAFHREVIERKPEQFKIECLSDIKRLFGEKNPFYAGYGNRINDVWAYRAVGIPIMRIYTINPRGELKHELTQTFQSTYAKQLSIVDQLFPPIIAQSINDDEDDIEYTAFNFWREPFADVDYQMDPNLTLQIIQSKPLPTIPEN